MNRLLLLLFFITFHSECFAQGGSTGNGGGTHYCPNRLTPLEFYDLYEGRTRPENPIPVYATLPTSVQDFQKKSLEILEALNPFFASRVGYWLSYVQTQSNVIPVHKKLRIVQDAHYLGVDDDCEYRQLANWNDREDRIYVNDAQYALIQRIPRDLLAFQFHEAIYKAARENSKVDNSDLTRTLVAYLFSPVKLPDVFSPLYASTNIERRPDLGKEPNIFQEGKYVRIHLGMVQAKDIPNLKLKLKFANSYLQQSDARKKELEERIKIASRRERKRLERELLELLKKSYALQFYIHGSEKPTFTYLDAATGYSEEKTYDLSSSEGWSALQSGWYQGMILYPAASWFKDLTFPNPIPLVSRIEKTDSATGALSSEAILNLQVEGHDKVIREGSLKPKISWY